MPNKGQPSSGRFTLVPGRFLNALCLLVSDVGKEPQGGFTFVRQYFPEVQKKRKCMLPMKTNQREHSLPVFSPIFRRHS